jgi:hypothetical protein
MSSTLTAAKDGLQVTDLREDAAFAARKLPPRDAAAQMDAIRRIARAFVEKPEAILQELVNAAVEVCGADSAGISVEREDAGDAEFYHWVAVAGEYSAFLDARLPRYPSACGICLHRGGPQSFQVSQAFFDILGIQAPLVTDGVLLPWNDGVTRGTIFIIAHGRTEAFDMNDCQFMQTLADFAVMGIRQQRLQTTLLQQAANAAAVEMANQLAHEINNPLQGLTNLFFLAAQGSHGEEAKVLGQRASAELHRLSALVNQLLALPSRKSE